MKKRGLLTIQYNGECSFVPMSFGMKTFTLKPGVPVPGVDHEMLEILMNHYPGEIEVVGTEKEVKQEPVKQIEPVTPVEETFKEVLAKKRGGKR